MPNYKPIRDDVIDIGGYRHVMKATDKILVLYSPKVAAIETLHDSEAGANYQVPTGKKTKIIIASYTANSGFEHIAYSDDLDASTNPVKMCEPKRNLTNALILSLSAPAEKYINKTCSVAADDYFDVYVLEEDA